MSIAATRSTISGLKNGDAMSRDVYPIMPTCTLARVRSERSARSFCLFAASRSWRSRAGLEAQACASAVSAACSRSSGSFFMDSSRSQMASLMSMFRNRT